MKKTEVSLLVVEDDDVDVAAVRRAFATLKIDNPIVVARNGDEALACLRGDPGSPPLQAPSIVLLDLNMPKMNGIELLEEIRRDPDLRKAVVFVLTTSNAPGDRRACYERNVAGYMLKSQTGKSFLDTIAMLRTYWTLNEFPA
jgi:CheY-like chemotaxis protein